MAAKAKEIVTAAGNADLAALERLAAAGADFNASYRHYRPIHALIQEKPHAASGGTEGRNRCLEWLLRHGADPEQTGAWPQARALLVATWVGEPMYVETLRRTGAVIDGHVAAAFGDLARVKKEIGKDAGFPQRRDNGDLTPLHCCCASRMQAPKLTEVARVLLAAGADPVATVRSWGNDVDAPYFAVNSGQLATLELLLDAGADPTAALPAAAWKTDSRFAKLILDRGADPDKAVSGDRPLLNDLIRWGQFQQALWLMANGASPNVACGIEGWTAAHQAASRGNVKMWRAVVEAGADLQRRDKQGRTPADIRRLPV